MNSGRDYGMEGFVLILLSIFVTFMCLGYISLITNRLTHHEFIAGLKLGSIPIFVLSAVYLGLRFGKIH